MNVFEPIRDQYWAKIKISEFAGKQSFLSKRWSKCQLFCCLWNVVYGISPTFSEERGLKCNSEKLKLFKSTWGKQNCNWLRQRIYNYIFQWLATITFITAELREYTKTSLIHMSKQETSSPNFIAGFNLFSHLSRSFQ